MKKFFQSNLGPRLKGLRGAVSQSQMASSLGVPQQTYANWELGIRQPKLDDLGALSLQLGVTSDYLLGLSDSPTGHGSNSATNSPGAVVGQGAHGGNCATCPLLQAAAKKIASLA